MKAVWTRRTFIGALPLLLDGETLPAELKRLRDPATEFDLVRLTDPEHTSYLPPAHLYGISQKNNSLVFCSDRTGTMQAFRGEIKNGESRQLSQGEDVDPTTLSYLPDERSVCYFDGPALMQTSVNGVRHRTVYRIESGFTRTPGFGLTADGIYAVFSEERQGAARLRLLNMARGTAATVIEGRADMRAAMPRPRRAGILYRSEDTLWLVNHDGQQNRRLKTAAGAIGPALWSPDGKTVLYLLYPEAKNRLHELREHTPDTNEDKLIAATSQFVNFTRNSDASVFAGVSNSKASPHVLLLLRVTRRELTLCEHKASDPSKVTVLFSPNSQRLFYQTDRQGKPAIYTVLIERFVEKTET